MVTVRFSGRFANCVFQYWAAAAFAHKNDLVLGTPWPMDNWVRFKHEEYEKERKSVGHVYTQDIEINDGNFADYFSRHISEVPRANYTFTGYFQRMDLLHSYAWRLYDWFDWSPIKPRGEAAIALHVRLGDHGGGRLYLDPQWYVSILERQSWGRVTILTDDPNATGHFEAYKKWNPKIQFSPNAMDDFDTLRSHRVIVIGPSSFAVIAALTGCATKIYQWSRDQELPHIKYTIPWAVQVDGKYWRETR